MTKGETLSRLGRKGAAAGVMSLLILSYAGYFKASVFFAWVPVDLTLLGTMLVAVLLLTAPVGTAQASKFPAAVVLVWATFIPGAMYAWLSNYELSKTYYLFSITVLAALSAKTLLASALCRRYWIVGQIFAGVVMALSLLSAPDTAEETEFGRLTSEGLSTIASGRVVGAGVVVCFLLATATGQRHRFMLFGLGVSSLITLLLVGSRGPILATVLASGLSVVVARRYKSSRAFVVAAVTAGVAGLGWVVLHLSWRSTDRLTSLLVGAHADTARQVLYGRAISAIATHPAGVGWGGFAYLQPHRVESSSGVLLYPHNFFLEIFLEGGWVAGIAAVMFVFVCLRRLVACSTGRDELVLLGLALYWLMAAQTSSDVNGNRMTWVSLAVAFALAPAHGYTTGPRVWAARNAPPLVPGAEQGVSAGVAIDGAGGVGGPR